MKSTGRLSSTPLHQRMKLFDFSNFSLREALWLAILIHLIILFFPTAMIPPPPPPPFIGEPPASDEPMVFSMVPPEEPPSEKPKDKESLPSNRNREAALAERPEEESETIQPRIRGDSNLERLEPRQPRETGEGSNPREPADVGPAETQPREEPSESEEREEKRQKEMSEKLGEILKTKPLLHDMDLPYTYDQPEASQDGPLKDQFELSTYAWDYEPWLAKLRWKIYKYWPPKLRETVYLAMGRSGYTVWHVKIDRIGKIVQISLRSPSGIDPYDRASKYAIEIPFPGLASPFPPLPEHFPLNHLEITMHFIVHFY